jgi:hypothetical protein
MDQQTSDQPPAKPNNCLVWSILSTLFCCLPFGCGLAAIVIYFAFMGTILATLGFGAMEGLENMPRPTDY